MNPKTKKIICKILKIIWIIVGVFLFLGGILIFHKMSTFNGSGVSGVGTAIGLGILWIISISVFAFYIGITILFLFIKWLVKKFRKKK
jgi:hypothetical protein